MAVIMAPDGRSKKKLSTSPTKAPTKATMPDRTIMRGKVCAKDIAMACGIENTESTRIMPTALIESEMAKATNTEARADTSEGCHPERRA